MKMEHWMLEHKQLVDLFFIVLIYICVWLIIRFNYKDTYMSLKEMKPLYRILIFLAITAVLYLLMILTSKFSLVGAIIIIGLPFALISLI